MIVNIPNQIHHQGVVFKGFCNVYRNQNQQQNHNNRHVPQPLQALKYAAAARVILLSYRSFPKKWRIFGQNYLMQQFAVLLLKANIYKKIQFGPQRIFKDVHTKKRESLGVCCLFTRVFKVKIVWTPSFTPHPCTLHNILLTMMIILTIMVVTLQGPWGCRVPNA